MVAKLFFELQDENLIYIFVKESIKFEVFVDTEISFVQKHKIKKYSNKQVQQKNTISAHDYQILLRILRQQ